MKFWVLCLFVYCLQRMDQAAFNGGFILVSLLVLKIQICWFALLFLLLFFHVSGLRWDRMWNKHSYEPSVCLSLAHLISHNDEWWTLNLIGNVHLGPLWLGFTEGYSVFMDLVRCFLGVDPIGPSVWPSWFFFLIC